MADCCHPQDSNTHDHAAHRAWWKDWLLLVTGITCLLALAVALTEPEFLPESTLHFAHQIAEILGTIWWGVAIGILAVGLLSRIPDDWVPRLLGQGGGVKGLLRAIGAGLLLDLCSHGILLVGMQLYRKGASLGQTYAFLLASPWNSFSLTLILISLVGWQWTAIFILGSAVIAFVSGWLIDRFVPPAPAPESAGAPLWPEVRQRASRWTWRDLRPANLLRVGLLESVMLIRWLLLGVVLAAALRSFLPDDLFEQTFAPTLLGLAATLIVTTLIEACSEGSTPIAADILTRAHAPGNAFAFLMAGVATDYTEVMMLKETTRRWALALAMPLVSVPQILLIGYILNQFNR